MEADVILEEKCKKCDYLRRQLVRALSTMEKKNDVFEIKKELEQVQAECEIRECPYCRRKLG